MKLKSWKDALLSPGPDGFPPETFCSCIPAQLVLKLADFEAGFGIVHRGLAHGIFSIQASADHLIAWCYPEISTSCNLISMYFTGTSPPGGFLPPETRARSSLGQFALARCSGAVRSVVGLAHEGHDLSPRSTCRPCGHTVLNALAATVNPLTINVGLTQTVMVASGM